MGNIELFKEIQGFLDNDEPEVPNAPGRRSLCDFAAVLGGLDSLEIQGRIRQMQDVPRLVILGAESVGKSSLLNRLCQLQVLPVDEEFCTKLAITVRFRYSGTWGEMPPATIQVWDVSQNAPVGDRKETIEDEQRCLGNEISSTREIVVEIFSCSYPALDVT